jgi:hypothetical protein
MRIYRGIFLVLLFSLSVFLSTAVRAQQTCPPPPVPDTRGTNIFNNQQEMDLGDAIAEQIQRDYKVIDDPELTAYLQRVGDRLVQRMPPSSIKFRFFVYERAVANAFGIPGGRVYVSRKLISFMKSEDELAGLLGHELGHLAAHQGAYDFSNLLREVLGITSVTDRKDIFEKYNMLQDTWKRKPEAFQKIASHGEAGQLVADHLGLYLSSTSGYDSRALVKFWDRFAETKGKKGSFFSDLFGTTKPEEKRLREMDKESIGLPGPCGDTRPASSPADFAAWQVAVLNYTGVGHRESLHGVLWRRALEPPLRGDIRYLRFSPDGKYVLAQDDSSIYVLTREPFAPLYRVDAPEAHPAIFSADSSTFSFYTRGLRVETWNVADQERTGLFELVSHRSCILTELSPDGKYLACYGGGTLDLVVLDVSTGQPVFEKKSFYQPRTYLEYFLLLIAGDSDVAGASILTMRFSPDSHYFVASSHDETVEAFDLTARKSVSLPGSIKRLLTREFEFLAPDRLAGIDPNRPDKSGIVRFPTGETIEEVGLGTRNIQAVARGNYVLLRPIRDYAVGVLDLNTKKIFMADKESAFDIFDTVAVVERLDGEIALKQISDNQQIAKVMLPRGPLAPLRAGAVSPDLRWVALSERSRGGVWDLPNNQRVFYVRGFNGAYLSPDGILYADFPKMDKTERAMGQLVIGSRATGSAYEMKEDHYYQAGPYLIVTKPNKEGGKLDANVTKEIRDAATGKTLWSRSFAQEAPRVSVEPIHGKITFYWRMSTKAAKQERESNSNLTQQAEGVKNDDNNFLMEVVDARTGNVEGGLVLDTNKGSFLISDIFAVGKYVIVTDSSNRVMVYSMVNGEQTGRTFGHVPEVSVASGLVAMDNEAGQVILYDLAKMERRDEYQFTSPVVMKRFSDDGKRLFLLTASQVAYILDVSAAMNPATRSSASN